MGSFPYPFNSVPSDLTQAASWLQSNFQDAADTAYVDAAVSAGGGAVPSDDNPLMDGTASPGVSSLVSRKDHVHPSDTSRLALAGGTMSGAIAMGSSKVTGLAAATANGDAVRYEQAILQSLLSASDQIITHNGSSITVEKQSGKRVSSGLAELTTQYGPTAIAFGNYSAALMSITVTGDNATKMRLRAYLPIVEVSVTGNTYYQIWDGTIGSGTKVAEVLKNQVAGGAGYDYLYWETEVAAFSGSKTFSVAILNPDLTTKNYTVYADTTSRRNRFDAVWQA